MPDYVSDRRREARVIPGSVSRAGVTEMREHFRKMPDWSFGDILTVSICLEQADPETTVDFTRRKRACQ